MVGAFAQPCGSFGAAPLCRSGRNIHRRARRNLGRYRIQHQHIGSTRNRRQRHAVNTGKHRIDTAFDFFHPGHRQAWRINTVHATGGQQVAYRHVGIGSHVAQLHAVGPGGHATKCNTAPAGALNRIASGGELSRFLLALKVCLTASQTGLTLIFDEIDRGVGGATADAVGRRLKALADGAQVLVVTHSPQVAAFGARHWRVEKRVAKGATLSTVTPLDAGERVEEIARMLAGDTVTEAARAAARALLG